MSESFSIGLTVLQAGMLFDFSYLYNLRSFKMDYDRFMDKFKEWSEMKHYSEEQRTYISYSPELRNAILGLCELDPKKRILSL